MARGDALRVVVQCIELEIAASGKAPTVFLISKVVARSFGVSVEDLGRKSRRLEFLLPRQVAMYLSDRYAGAGVYQIGRTFNRHHTSVKNAIEKIAEGVET